MHPLLEFIVYEMFDIFFFFFKKYLHGINSNDLCHFSVLSTKEAHWGATDSADGPTHSSSEILHAHPSNTISDAPNTVSSSLNTNKDSVSETPGDLIGIKRKPDEAANKYEQSKDEIMNAETQPKTNPADLTGAKTENTKPAIIEPEDLQRTVDGDVVQHEIKTNGGTPQIKTEDIDCLADDQKSAAASPSLLKTALISPPRGTHFSENEKNLRVVPLFIHCVNAGLDICMSPFQKVTAILVEENLKLRYVPLLTNMQAMKYSLHTLLSNVR